MNQLQKPFRSLRRFSTNSIGRSVCSPKPDYGPMEVQRSTLLNGIKVAAAKPLGAEISACTIMFQAGSRFEYDDYIGVSHFIRACSTASGCAYSGYNKMKVLHQYGVSISCITDRQSIAFTMRCPFPMFADLKYYLLDTAARCCYYPWEADDCRQMVYEDLIRLSPEQRAIDLVQTACWTGPLANSTFCVEERIDGVSGDILNSFAVEHYKTDQLTIASVGLPFEETMKLAEMSEYTTEKPQPRSEYLSCPRSGFEAYDLGAGSETWIAVAVPGCGTCDLNTLFRHAIIAAACGMDNIAMGFHDTDRTPMPPLGTMAGSDIHTSYRPFNISYRETGVFGILARTRACSAWKVTLAASEFLTNIGGLNYKQIEIGKARLKLSLSRHDDDCTRVSEGLALQLANNIQLDSASQSMDIIDQISNADICNTAAALAAKSCDMAFAVVGDVGAVPHDMELIRCFRP